MNAALVRPAAAAAGLVLLLTGVVGARSLVGGGVGAASAADPSAAEKIDEGVAHLKKTTISYPDWLRRKYAPGVRETTEWGLAFAAFDAAKKQLEPPPATTSTAATTTAATTTTTTAPPPATTAPPPATTSASPSGTVQAGANLDTVYDQAAPGSVLQLQDGSYPNVTITGTKTSPVTFRGSRAAVLSGITVRATNLTLEGVTVASSFSTKKEAADVVFRNVKARGFFIESSQRVSVLGGEQACGVCDYHPQISSEYQVDVAPTDIVIDGVDFHDWQAASAGQHTECLQIGGGLRVTIRNSTFRQCATATPNNATGDLHVSWYGFGPRTRDVAIEGNFFYPSGGFYAAQINAFQGLRLRYNSFGQGVVFYHEATTTTPVEVRGNVLPYQYGACFTQNGTTPMSFAYNVFVGAGKCGATDKQASSAGFVSSADMHLAAGSAAIDAGDPANYPSSDIDGQQRTALPDAGADER